MNGNLYISYAYCDSDIANNHSPIQILSCGHTFVGA